MSSLLFSSLILFAFHSIPLCLPPILIFFSYFSISILQFRFDYVVDIEHRILRRREQSPLNVGLRFVFFASFYFFLLFLFCLSFLILCRYARDGMNHILEDGFHKACLILTQGLLGITSLVPFLFYFIGREGGRECYFLFLLLFSSHFNYVHRF